MMKAAVLLAVAGTALMTACSEPGDANNLTSDNALAIDGNVLANVAGDIAPLNESAAGPATSEAAAANSGASSSVAEQPRAAAPDRAKPAPASRQEPATNAQADRPARTERTAPRPAPKQEPAPPPTSNCTAEHEAMGHCKQ